MNRTIIGIDPGTTAAFAVLDLKGGLLHVESLRGHDPADMIKRIIRYGKPILVGCDKKNPPMAVAKIARSVGGRLVSPFEDLKIDEKRLLVSEKTKNDHEFDALASARLAQERYVHLFEKIEKVLERQGSLELADSVKEFLLKNEEMNISEAVRILEAGEKRSEKKEKRKKEYSLLAQVKDELSIMVELYSLMKLENHVLRKRLRSFEERRAHPSKSRDVLLKEKEERIHVLSRRLEEARAMVVGCEREISEWKSVLRTVGSDFIVVRKVVDFEAYKKEKMQDDVVFFERLTGMRNEGESPRIILTREVSRSMRGLIVLDARLFHLKEKEGFVLVRRDELDSALKKKEVFSKIIKDYQASRR